MCENVAAGVASYAEWAPHGFHPAVAASDPHQGRERFLTPGFRAHVQDEPDGTLSVHVACYPAADEPACTHLMHLFVRPHHQGSGVAAALPDLGVEDARATGSKQMRLRTPAGNARGLAFYRREGFAVTGESSDDAGMGLPVLWMRRTL